MPNALHTHWPTLSPIDFPAISRETAPVSLLSPARWRAVGTIHFPATYVEARVLPG